MHTFTYSELAAYNGLFRNTNAPVHNQTNLRSSNENSKSTFLKNTNSCNKHSFVQCI